MNFQFSVFGSYTSRFGFRFGSVNRRPLLVTNKRRATISLLMAQCAVSSSVGFRPPSADEREGAVLSRVFPDSHGECVLLEPVGAALRVPGSGRRAARQLQD